jgi:hypothetical protein
MYILPKKALNEFRDLLFNATGKVHSDEEVTRQAEAFMSLLVSVLKTKLKKCYSEDAVT